MNVSAASPDLCIKAKRRRRKRTISVCVVNTGYRGNKVSDKKNWYQGTDKESGGEAGSELALIKNLKDTEVTAGTGTETLGCFAAWALKTRVQPLGVASLVPSFVQQFGRLRGRNTEKKR